MTDMYFDYAAATPLDAEVLESMMPYFSDDFYNPSALYGGAMKARRALDDARQLVARTLEVKQSEIIFTAGCTEANNLAIHGAMIGHPGKKVIVSSIEHDSVFGPAQRYECLVAPVKNTGIIDLDALDRMLDDDGVVLVSIIYANNEIGVIQPLREIARLIEQKRRSGRTIWLHTDAAQAANYLPLKPHSLGIDMMSLNGGKIYGPKQSGCLWVSSAVSLRPMMQGGGQERSLRPGTENVAQAVGFAYALQKAVRLSASESSRLGGLRDLLVDACEQIGGEINGSKQARLPNNINISFAGQDAESLVMALDESGVAVATGSACHASSGEKSRVLAALGLGDTSILGALRITLGRHTTKESVDALIDRLKKLLQTS